MKDEFITKEQLIYILSWSILKTECLIEAEGDYNQARKLFDNAYLDKERVRILLEGVRNNIEGFIKLSNLR